MAFRQRAYRLAFVVVITGCSLRAVLGAPPLPPSELAVVDVPHDAGTALKLIWKLSPDDSPQANPPLVTGYRIQRSINGGEAKSLAAVPAGTAEFLDQGCRPGKAYRYTLAAVGANDEASIPLESSAMQPVVSWFNAGKTELFIYSLIICGALLISTELARRGKPVYVRPIAGLQAIEEAVGRATEMGRPIFFVPGIQDMNEMQTVAGVTVLSHVAQTAAQYDMPLDVPTARSLVMAAARDSAQAGCLSAGRPEVYDPNRIYYVTDEQFGYVAHLCGRMLREQPAACFYIGQFFAESLLLSETGNSIRAIQIAGTAEAAQMPFFVAACDYTLLGEEIFAASAYLSREPEQLGMLRGQDLGKLLAMALILTGCLWATLPAELRSLNFLRYDGLFGVIFSGG